MATVRELQASFIAKASGMKSAIQGVKRDINGLKKSSDNVSSGMSRNLESFGKSMTNFGGGLQKASKKAGNFGKSLTKRITLPAAGVATALGGITAALGWKRIVGLDTAQAQLKGLGYNTKEVGRISEQVESAIEGGMTTMAEGTAVAAGGMAAGVKEGKELERYIKLVGDAAVGSNRPVNEMAQIFNRVQGSGKLMTQELNMIEQGMPGFAMAMADNLDVSQDKFREMVTNGEVDSKQFLDVMEGFAGGMADAYSDSWQGMVANTKAYIGIIGESLLGGVFEKSKESIAEFISFLKSDEVVAWAEKAGKKIGEMFSIVVDKVKSAIQWFANLSKSQQGLITKFGAIAVAAGPVLLALASIGGIIGKVSSGIGTLMMSASKAGGVFGLLSKTAADGTKKVGLLARAFTLLTGPVGITMGIITALVAGFTLAYKKSDTFRGIVNKLKDAFLNAVSGIKEFLTTNETILAMVDGIKSAFTTMRKKVNQAIGAVVGFFRDKIRQMTSFWDSEGSQFLQAFSNIFGGIWKVVEPVIKAVLAIVKKTLPIIQAIFKTTFGIVLEIVKMVWGNIKGVIDGGLQVIMGLIKTFSGLFTGDFSKMWEGVKDIFSGAVKFVWNFVQLQFFGRLLKGVGSFIKLFSSPISKMWTGIRNVFSAVIKWIVEFVKNRFTAMNNTITTITTAIRNVISKIWNSILSFFKMVIKAIVDFAKKWFTNFKNNVTSIFNSVRKFITTIWNAILSFFKTVIKAIVDFVKSRFTNLKNNVTTIFNSVRKFISTVWNAIYSFFKTVIKAIVDFVKTRFNNLKTNVTNIFNGIKSMAKRVWNGIKDNIINPVKNGVNWAIKKFKGFKDSVTETFKNIKDNVFGYVSDMIQKVKDMPGEMKQKIIDGAGKVKSGMLEIGRKMVDGIKSGVNGVIAAVEWVLKKFDSDKKLGRWNPANTFDWYARGTKGHPEDGPAVVGDGTGSNAGPELIQDPKGNFSLSPAKPTLIPNMPKGTQVWSATETREALAPRYAWGINFKDVAKALSLGGEAMTYSDSKTDQVLGKAASGLGTGIDVYADAPKTLLKAGLKAMGVEVPDFPAVIGDMAKGGFEYVKDKAVDFIKGKQEEELESVAGPTSGGAKAWRSHIRKAAARMNEAITNRHVSGIIAQINRESGGNEKITQSSAVVDINTLSGNPARGLLQYIPQTFAAYAMKGHKNIYSGYDQLLAFFNNTNWRRDLPYGTRGWGPTGARKYADGGIVDTKQLAWIAEGGWAESIISHDPAKRVRQQRIWQDTGDRLGFTDRDDNKKILATLERIAKSVEDGQDLSVVMDSRVVGNLVEPHVSNRQDRKKYRSRKS